MHTIDAHNHSLPFIDDGAKDMDMALAMLRVAESTGTKEIILTPHHLHGAYTNFADNVIKQAEVLTEHAEKNNIFIKLHTASEVHLVPETVEQLLNQKALTYCGHGKAALVELPKHSLPMGVEKILNELVGNGIIPIIAHPERNSSLRNDPAPLREWIQFGCKSQVTGQSCTGAFGKALQQTTLSMISEGLVHLVASDAHRPEGRSPSLADAITVINQLFGEETRNLLFSDNPAHLIAGTDLVNPVEIDNVSQYHNTARQKRGWLDRLKTSIK